MSENSLVVPNLPDFHLPAEQWVDVIPRFNKTRLRELAGVANVRGRSKMSLPELAVAVVEALTASPEKYQPDVNRVYKKWAETQTDFFAYKSTLRTEYGLTDKWIDLLPVYKTVKNPHYSSAAPGKLYYRPMVEEMIELNRDEYSRLQAGRDN